MPIKAPPPRPGTFNRPEREEWKDYDGNDDDDEMEVEAANNKNEVIRAATERAIRKASSKTKIPKAMAPKFGPTMLLGNRGFKYLRQKVAELKYKEDPTSDLDQLMALYRDWAHYLYPKFVFSDFVDKVERQCRTTSMKTYLIALLRAQEEGQNFDELEFTTNRNVAEAKLALANDDNANVTSYDEASQQGNDHHSEVEDVPI